MSIKVIEDLSFLKGRTDLTDEEIQILKIANMDGDYLLEKSDFNYQKAKKIISDLGIDGRQSKDKQIWDTSTLLFQKCLERAMPDISPETRVVLARNIPDKIRSCGLASWFQIAQKINGLYQKPFFASLSIKDQEVTINVLMVIEDSIFFNNALPNKKISVTFSEDMMRVAKAIYVGTIRVVYQPQKFGVDAHYFQNRISVDQANERTATVIHEAIHAKQDLLNQPLTLIEQEREAYLISAMYEGLAYGFDSILISVGGGKSQRPTLIEEHQMQMKQAAIRTAEGRARWLEHYIEIKIIQARLTFPDVHSLAKKMAKLIYDEAPPEAIKSQENAFDEAYRETIMIKELELDWFDAKDLCRPHVESGNNQRNGLERSRRVDRLLANRRRAGLQGEKAYSFLLAFQAAMKDGNTERAQEIVDEIFENLSE